VVLYTDRRDGKQELKEYNTLTRSSSTITTENFDIVDLTTARLSNSDHAILIAMRDENNMPWVALATAADGVFHREQYATYGTAADDAVEIRRYRVEDLERTKGDLKLIQPAAVVVVPMSPDIGSAAGMYEVVLPAADASMRRINLNLRPDGSATLVSIYADKGDPIVRRGKWEQQGKEVRLELDSPKETLVWALTGEGLAPKVWDSKRWGSTGLPFRKPQAPVSVPRTAPGTVR
jgi:hypothetical protein